MRRWWRGYTTPRILVVALCVWITECWRCPAALPLPQLQFMGQASVVLAGRRGDTYEARDDLD